MALNTIKTLGELKANNYVSKSIKDELRDNLIHKLKNNIQTFEGIFGYEHTVLPQLEQAILSKHNINLLGLRGQAKTRIARQLVNLLDEYIPVVEGSEINDDPLKPISRFAKDLIEKQQDDTPISWLHRSERFAEKLATPDVTVADLIGDIDPIKAANLKLSYADHRVIHFGMIPRANRCIFVINELPDLQARIQVALFNILQEGDVQIRGFNLRLPLDLQFVFTANPEDYTNRGSIVTPLKDRIGSQILTHYPKDIEIAKKITAQEANLSDFKKQNIKVPELAKTLLEQISIEARHSNYVDAKSGVSARLSISAFENMMSAAERRALVNGDDKTCLRLSDFNAIIPAITGKVELVYEGEEQGAEFVANELIESAIKVLYTEYFPEIKKLEKEDEKQSYDDVLAWFMKNDDIQFYEDDSNAEYESALSKIKPLKQMLDEYVTDYEKDEQFFWMEFILWGLSVFKKLDRNQVDTKLNFGDSFGSFIKGL
ncbi:magnesium chelatase [Psychroflexus aestuariivivens]|uniref:magnesium chelatase n=1 Tax=Psychroflexus aestuariivivens TaxID=1795040 RepID=UPI000FD986A3|nr:magnesium chelatase [Psychroflexus aestuariivivens]